MSRFKYIKTTLESFQDLFYAMSENDYECSVFDDCVLHEVSLNEICETDYYGIDFSGEKSVYMLFHVGGNNFPGIWTGHDDKERIEEMPVYMFDLQGRPIIKCWYRNLRSFLQDEALKMCYDYFASNERKNLIDMNEVKRLQQFVDTLSEKYVEKTDYVLSINDEHDIIDGEVHFR